jgi:ATP-dependent DNA helicase RecG
MDGSAKITEIKGVGEKTAKLFQKLNIRTVEDLLHNYPRDYEDFREPLAILDCTAGELCSVRACLAGNITAKKVRNLTILNFVVKDAGGQIFMTYFNMPYVKSILKKGLFYIFRGVVQEKNGRLVMEQAKIYKPEEYFKLTGILQPRYPLTAGLSNHMVARAIKQALSLYEFPPDHLPEWVKDGQQLADHRKALEEIHFPPDLESMRRARRRLAFDEFFLFILMLRKCREQNEGLENRYPMMEAAQTKRLLEALPYELTVAQKRVWEEIKADLQGKKVMNRLIQGDVGSGKTILAFLALLMCAANGYQGALMAPTEVLAAQHYESMTELTEKYGLPFRPVLLTGSMTAKEKRRIYEAVSCGTANVIIGTHALIQERVEYRKLALVVTDEQHRFGVRQREHLAEKGENVHVMVMSATPIPRTLAIILYGDLDISLVDELPADRLPIKNCVVGTEYREKAYRFITREVEAGRQVYVICPMVEEGELEGVENVVSYTEKLRSILPQDIQVACLHGKMRPADKNRIMEEYAAHNIDVLVSTTVIEVGINVPNAAVMMIENAERFGLAQLHQLRGRVGRGEYQSYCIFINGSGKPQAFERLDILNRSNDGFYIAEEDLKMRGPGDLFGIRQSGLMDFKVGDVYQDADLLKEAGACVEKLLAEDEGMERPEHRALLDYVDKVFWQADVRTI